MKYLLFDGSEGLGFDLIWTFDQFNCWSPFIHLTQIAKLEKDISADRSYQLTRRLWDLWKYISKYEFRLSTFGFWTFRGRSMCIFSWCLLVIIKASYMWTCSFFDQIWILALNLKEDIRRWVQVLKWDQVSAKLDTSNNLQ